MTVIIQSIGWTGPKGELIKTAGRTQRALELPDLFAPHLRRERVVDWQAPGPAAEATMTMSGMEAVCAIRDGILPPPPPMAKPIGLRMVTVEPGRIVMELDPEESLENTIGLMHGRPPRRSWIPPWAAPSRPCF